MEDVIIPVYVPNTALLPTRIGDEWYDLRTTKQISFKKGQIVKINFNFIMNLPDGYEAIIAPRSSTLERYGLIMSGIGIIDNRYCGKQDEIGGRFYAICDGTIMSHTAIVQFRIIPTMKENIKLNLAPLKDFPDSNRGGFGSTDENLYKEAGYTLKEKLKDLFSPFDTDLSDAYEEGYHDGFSEAYDKGFLAGIEYWEKHNDK